MIAGITLILKKTMSGGKQDLTWDGEICRDLNDIVRGLPSSLVESR